MIDASSLIIPRFHDVLGDVMAHGHTHYWLFGGRGSTKSSFISLAIVLVILANPGANAVVVRRFSNTLRDSVFQQMTWAIAALGLERWFRARISPMELTYVPTGQRIVFRGADDPLKLKGVKFTRGYCAVVWFEELDQFDGIEAVRSILNSLRRGSDDFWIFYSYNPPRTLWSWVNREKLERERRVDTLVRQSSYLDVAEAHPEWLGAPFIEEAEYLREVDEAAWRNEYLGDVTGTGGSAFNNVVEERVTDARMRSFGLVRCGVDWGWFPDPWRMARVGWEPGERRLTIFSELTANRKTPAETAAIAVEALTFADEAGRRPIPARRADLVRRHAGRQAVDSGVAARLRAEGAAGAQEQHAPGLLRVAGGTARDRNRSRAVPLDARRVPPEGIRARPRRHVDRRHPGRQRPLDRRGALRDDGRRVEGVMDVGFASEPLAKRKTAGAGRLWDGMLRIRTMLADQVLGRLAILALVLLVVLALKMGEKRLGGIRSPRRPSPPPRIRPWS